ncbi:unnamed protein product [Heligmosomoides polygyrus]|uniref:CheW-like domain-containing protein n=1 Tax=Heligmosomoides polygyrus TaxID=6339 RepID=A0A183GW09_HELPZ|nr:unnamed protein product [Heligmosomoides polygyrus]
MAVLIIDAEELLDVLGLPMAILSKDFLKIIAPSSQCLLAVHKKMAVLIIDAEELLDVLGLPMAILSKWVQIPLTIA